MANLVPLMECKQFLQCRQYSSTKNGDKRSNRWKDILEFDGVGLAENADWLMENYPKWFKSYDQIYYMLQYGWFWSLKEERPVWVHDYTWTWISDWWWGGDDELSDLESFQGKVEWNFGNTRNLYPDLTIFPHIIEEYCKANEYFS